jgi:uncharacterized protein
MTTQVELSITVVYSPAPRVLHEITLALPAGACVRDALAASAQDARFAEAASAAVSSHMGASVGVDTNVGIGVWGKKAALHQLLMSQDRIELYRPLRVDPKVARRERFKKQGAKSAGLFAKRRPGAKPGY